MFGHHRHIYTHMNKSQLKSLIKEVISESETFGSLTVDELLSDIKTGNNSDISKKAFGALMRAKQKSSAKVKSDSQAAYAADRIKRGVGPSDIDPKYADLPW